MMTKVKNEKEIKDGERERERERERGREREKNWKETTREIKNASLSFVVASQKNQKLPQT